MDIDTYDLTDEEMNNIVIAASRENLVPTRTKSGGYTYGPLLVKKFCKIYESQTNEIQRHTSIKSKDRNISKQEQLKTG